MIKPSIAWWPFFGGEQGMMENGRVSDDQGQKG